MSTMDRMTPGTFTHRTHRAGGVLLMISGVISAILGLATLFGVASLGSVTGTTVAGGAVAGGILGVVFLVFGLIEFGGGYTGYRGHNWYGSIVGCVLGLFTVVTLPLAIGALVLLSLGEGQFPMKEEETAETVADEDVHHPSD